MTKKSTLSPQLRNRLVSGFGMVLGIILLIWLPSFVQLLVLLAMIFLCHREWQVLARATPRPFYWFFLGFFYILAAAIGAIYLLLNAGAILLLNIAIVAATDIGGYIFGKKFGGKKLIPRISPNKTWAGLGGGLLLTIGVVWLFTLSVNHWQLASGLSIEFLSNPIRNFSVALAVSLSSVLGDILESRLKRLAQVKDSGNLIPGHGGLLDRLDGHLLASIVMALIVFFYSQML